MFFLYRKHNFNYTKKMYCYIHVLFSHRMPLQLLCKLAKCIIFYFFSILKLQFHFCHICVILLLLSEIYCVYVVFMFMLTNLTENFSGKSLYFFLKIQMRFVFKFLCVMIKGVIRNNK